MFTSPSSEFDLISLEISLVFHHFHETLKRHEPFKCMLGSPKMPRHVYMILWRLRFVGDENRHAGTKRRGIYQPPSDRQNTANGPLTWKTDTYTYTTDENIRNHEGSLTIIEGFFHSFCADSITGFGTLVQIIWLFTTASARQRPLEHWRHDTNQQRAAQYKHTHYSCSDLFLILPAEKKKNRQKHE